MVKPGFKAYGSTSFTDSSTTCSEDHMQTDPLTLLQKAAYSVGHIMNDAFSACWFTYLLVLLQEVRGLTPSQSGIVMLVGQTADAGFTVLNGMLSDASDGFPLLGMGRRKLFHALGSIVSSVNYFFAFGMCVPCIWRGSVLLYYCVVCALFNAGWSAVQVAHLSILTELVHDEDERVLLNSTRYAMTVFANVFVFASLWVLIYVFELTEERQFFVLCTACIVAGSFFSLIFQGVIIEPPRSKKKTEDLVTWKDWLNFNPFWQIALTYTCARLVVNISQIYIPFYVQMVLKLDRQFITVCPMIIYLASLIASVFMKKSNRVLGRKRTFVIGCILCAVALMWLYVLSQQAAQKHWYLIVSACMLLGLGNSTLMICATQLLADLVHTYTESAAFVYSGVSLFDKIANGLAICAVQQYNTGSALAVRRAVTVVPAAALVFAMVMLLFVPDIEDMNTMERKRERRWASTHAHSQLSQGALIGVQLTAKLKREPFKYTKQLVIAKEVAREAALGALLEQRPQETANWDDIAAASAKGRALSRELRRMGRGGEKMAVLADSMVSTMEYASDRTQLKRARSRGNQLASMDSFASPSNPECSELEVRDIETSIRRAKSSSQP